MFSHICVTNCRVSLLTPYLRGFSKARVDYHFTHGLDGTITTSGINSLQQLSIFVADATYIQLVHTYQGRGIGVLYTQPLFYALGAFLKKWA